MAKIATNGSGVMLSLHLIQVTESISGSVVPLAMFPLKSYFEEEKKHESLWLGMKETLPEAQRTHGIESET